MKDLNYFTKLLKEHFSFNIKDFDESFYRVELYAHDGRKFNQDFCFIKEGSIKRSFYKSKKN